MTSLIWLVAMSHPWGELFRSSYYYPQGRILIHVFLQRVHQKQKKSHLPG
jgi:hypothetical protein